MPRDRGVSIAKGSIFWTRNCFVGRVEVILLRGLLLSLPGFASLKRRSRPQWAFGKNSSANKTDAIFHRGSILMSTWSMVCFYWGFQEAEGSSAY